MDQREYVSYMWAMLFNFLGKLSSSCWKSLITLQISDYTYLQIYFIAISLSNVPEMLSKSWTSWHQNDGSKNPHNHGCKNRFVLRCIFVLRVIRWSFNGKRSSSSSSLKTLLIKVSSGTKRRHCNCLWVGVQRKIRREWTPSNTFTFKW